VSKVTFRREATPSTRLKAIELIKSEFPYLWKDVCKYAWDSGVDEGDVAVWIVAEVIYPYLKEVLEDNA